MDVPGKFLFLKLLFFIFFKSESYYIAQAGIELPTPQPHPLK